MTQVHYSNLERAFELEKENMGYWIGILEERLKKYGKQWEEEANNKLKELKDRGIDLAP